MKFSSQEEYGLRLLLRIAKSSSSAGMTIPELSEASDFINMRLDEMER